MEYWWDYWLDKKTGLPKMLLLMAPWLRQFSAMNPMLQNKASLTEQPQGVSNDAFEKQARLAQEVVHAAAQEQTTTFSPMTGVEHRPHDKAVASAALRSDDSAFWAANNSNQPEEAPLETAKIHTQAVAQKQVLAVKSAVAAVVAATDAATPATESPLQAASSGLNASVSEKARPAKAETLSAKTKSAATAVGKPDKAVAKPKTPVLKIDASAPELKSLPVGKAPLKASVSQALSVLTDPIQEVIPEKDVKPVAVPPKKKLVKAVAEKSVKAAIVAAPPIAPPAGLETLAVAPAASKKAKKVSAKTQDEEDEGLMAAQKNRENDLHMQSFVQNLPAELKTQLDKLNVHSSKEALRKGVLLVASTQDWTHADQLAAALQQKSEQLSTLHLLPMVNSGQLKLRHPEQIDHPEQAYQKI